LLANGAGGGVLHSDCRPEPPALARAQSVRAADHHSAQYHRRADEHHSDDWDRHGRGVPQRPRRVARLRTDEATVRRVPAPVGRRSIAAVSELRRGIGHANSAPPGRGSLLPGARALAMTRFLPLFGRRGSRWLVAAVCASAAVLVWIGYRAISEWEQA